MVLVEVLFKQVSHGFLSSTHEERLGDWKWVEGEMPKLLGVYPYKASKGEGPMVEWIVVLYQNSA
jgi:hypothetical protein